MQNKAKTSPVRRANSPAAPRMAELLTQAADECAHIAQTSRTLQAAARSPRQKRNVRALRASTKRLDEQLAQMRGLLKQMTPKRPDAPTEADLFAEEQIRQESAIVRALAEEGKGDTPRAASARRRLLAIENGAQRRIGHLAARGSARVRARAATAIGEIELQEGHAHAREEERQGHQRQSV